MNETREKQLAADRAHHMERIAWLSGESPRWACGALVAPSEALRLLTQSRECLRLIGLGMTTGSARPPHV